jgi:hypothetical protein
MAETIDDDPKMCWMEREIQHLQRVLASQEAKFSLAQAVCREAVPILKAQIENGCECDDDWCRCGIGNVRNLIGRMEAIARQ